MKSRGGRLSADIQPVIVADFIRNLKEEVRKGIQGRLRQSLYPFKAPRGYFNHGGGRVKTPDPLEEPLIIETFKQYASGEHSLRSLSKHMYTLGMSGSSGGPLSPQRLSVILHNTLYIDEMEVTGNNHKGSHQALITGELFHQTQTVLKRRRRKGHRRKRSHTVKC